MNLADTIRAAVEFVESAENGFLILGWRNRIWDALMAERPESCLFRWHALGCLAAKETLKSWALEETVPSEYSRLPHRALMLAIEKTLEVITLSHAEGQLYVLESDLDSMQFHHRNLHSYSPDTCVAAFKETLSWGAELLGDYEALDEDSDVRDVHYLASYDSCEGAWIAVRHRRYWLHWLHDLFPSVLVPRAELEAQLQVIRAELES